VYSNQRKSSSNRLENRKPQNETNSSNEIFVLFMFSVALKIDKKEIIRNRYLKIGFVIKPAPNAMRNGIAIQCTKQSDELRIPIKSALLIFEALIIVNHIKPIELFG
jgi:hypothetical protein